MAMVDQDPKKSRATRIGTFLVDRLALVAIVVFLQFISIGVVAWGIAASNQHANEQRVELKKSFDRQLDELKRNQQLILDCSSPGGKCFEDQIRSSSVGAVLGSISGSVNTMLECALPIPLEQRSQEKITACRQKAEAWQASIIAEARQNEKKPK
jgi:hypothetical protein